jgi:trehalose synthase
VAHRVAIGPQRSLAEHEGYPELAPAVAALRQHAQPVADALRGRTVWTVNSTGQGGGVSEMLPGIVAHLNELGITTEWVVIEAADPAFFPLTKRIHNLIHGEGTPDLDEADRAHFEQTNRANAAELRAWLRDGDVLVTHDPQPMPLAGMLRAELGITCLWRCHIGLDERTDATKAAWRFLRPYAQAYQHAVFSAPEYVPSYFEGRSSIIYPSLDPLSDKNRPLDDVATVLERGGLIRARSTHSEPPFPVVAQRLRADGRFGAGSGNEDIGFLERPIVTQVSRWDRLKGFLPLLHGFALLKQQVRRDPPADEAVRHRLDQVRLVLAGPEPESIADDPEGRHVLAELRQAWLALDERTRADVALIALPMNDLAVNALIVNALQRASTIVVQNSLREGFGLTITEAMWKRRPVLSNSRACGPRQQIRGGVDGEMISDPEDVGAIAAAIARMLADPAQLERWGRNAERRVHDHFLIYTQLRHWLRLFDIVPLYRT